MNRHLKDYSSQNFLSVNVQLNADKHPNFDGHYTSRIENRHHLVLSVLNIF